MKIIDLMLREPVTIDASETVHDAAVLMSRAGVGALVVTDGLRPVGIVTDRDLVTRALATGRPTDGRVDGIMSMGVVALDQTADVDDLFEVFKHHAVRRVPVVDHDTVVGMVTLDDAIGSMMSRFDQLAKVVAAQTMFPHAGDEAPAPVPVDSRSA